MRGYKECPLAEFASSHVDYQVCLFHEDRATFCSVVLVFRRQALASSYVLEFHDIVSAYVGRSMILQF